MREILFRGKNDNGYWIYGNLNFYPDINRTFIRKNNKELLPSFQTSLEEEVDTETVGQYTGLTDKNGKKIFEGDIVEYKQTDGAKRNNKPIICIGKVIYNTKTASFAAESKDKECIKYFDYFPIKSCEVIGNIHDNPELLGGGEF